nr:MAG TPA: hypothetical protein [Caudoviricetes sp.]
MHKVGRGGISTYLLFLVSSRYYIYDRIEKIYSQIFILRRVYHDRRNYHLSYI